MSSSNTYAPLPFSYLTGGNEKPTYGLKKSVSEEDGLDRSDSDKEPQNVFPGSTQPRKPSSNRESMDIIDSKLDVTDPYLLSTGRATGLKGDSLHNESRNSYTEDPRYRENIPSESDGGNVFFRSPDGSEAAHPAAVRSPKPRDQDIMRVHTPPQENYPAASLQRAAYTNPNVESITNDEETQPGKKLPRFMVGNSGVYQYYTGKDSSQGEGQIQDHAQGQVQGHVQGQVQGHVQGQIQQGKAQELNMAKPSKSTDNASNPIWDKYYAGNPSAPGYEGYPPNSPTSPAVRPMTKADDFNTLLRNSNSSGSLKNKGCCKTMCCAVVTAVFITAILCLGAGFAAGWFIYPVVNPTTAPIVVIDTTTAALNAPTTVGMSPTAAPTPAPTAAPTPAPTPSIAETTTTSAAAITTSTGTTTVTSQQDTTT